MLIKWDPRMLFCVCSVPAPPPASTAGQSCNNKSTVPEEGGAGWSSGQIAGLAVGMFFAGVMVAIIACMLAFRQRISGWKAQDDEVVKPGFT